MASPKVGLQVKPSGEGGAYKGVGTLLKHWGNTEVATGMLVACDYILVWMFFLLVVGAVPPLNIL